MDYKHTIITAFKSLQSHKTRASLTILGIVIGVSSIIIVMALGSGAQELIVNQISGLGAETLVIRPGKSPTDIANVLLSETLVQKDLDALEKRSNVPNLVSLSPFVFISEPIMQGGESYQSTVIGGSADFISTTFGADLEKGYLFNQNDIDTRARVAVIGGSIRDDMFGTGKDLGEDIRIKNQKFKVVGVFASQGQIGPFDFDQLVIVPYTTAQTYVTGSDHFQEVFIKVDSAENVDKALFDVTQTMREQHDIGPTEDDDFHIQTQQNLIDQIGTIINILTSFLTAVVAISLVVGGIGIMNIMLVSVTERTREIGLRKALGATRGDILRQFLFEAMILTGIGGIIGILIGAVVAFLAAFVLSQTVANDWVFSFPISAAVIGVVVSAGVGLVFGIYPASQAAKRSPIEALRYE